MDKEKFNDAANALLDFVIRASKKDATAAEIAALPAVANVLSVLAKAGF